MELIFVGEVLSCYRRHRAIGWQRKKDVLRCRVKHLSFNVQI